MVSSLCCFYRFLARLCGEEPLIEWLVSVRLVLCVLVRPSLSPECVSQFVVVCVCVCVCVCVSVSVCFVSLSVFASLNMSVLDFDVLN